MIEILKLGESEILIQGHSEICPEPVRAHFRGSTWGGSMLLMQKIGYKMHMEFVIVNTDKTLTTTSIESATLIGDGWEYEMWTN